MMCTRGGLALGLLTLAGLALPLVGCKSGIRVGGPSIEGTYRLMARDLPDGTRVEPPAIRGMITFADNMRHTTVYWTDDVGRKFTVCSISQYELIDNRYWEHNLFYMMNDESDAEGIRYDLSRPGGSSDVYHSGNGLVSFQLPLFDEPSVVFTRTGLTATRENEFVDHWTKID